MCELAEAQGIKLNYDDPEELVKQLSKVYDPYRLARNIARLCDGDGNNLFDFENMDDLEALSSLDKSVSEELSRALMVEEPKTDTARRKFQLILSLALGKTLAGNRRNA